MSALRTVTEGFSQAAEILSLPLSKGKLAGSSALGQEKSESTLPSSKAARVRPQLRALGHVPRPRLTGRQTHSQQLLAWHYCPARQFLSAEGAPREHWTAYSFPSETVPDRDPVAPTSETQSQWPESRGPILSLPHSCPHAEEMQRRVSSQHLLTVQPSSSARNRKTHSRPSACHEPALSRDSLACANCVPVPHVPRAAFPEDAAAAAKLRPLPAPYSLCCLLPPDDFNFSPKVSRGCNWRGAADIRTRVSNMWLIPTASLP